MPLSFVDISLVLYKHISFVNFIWKEYMTHSKHQCRCHFKQQDHVTCNNHSLFRHQLASTLNYNYYGISTEHYNHTHYSKYFLHFPHFSSVLVQQKLLKWQGSGMHKLAQNQAGCKYPNFSTPYFQGQ